MSRGGTARADDPQIDRLPAWGSCFEQFEDIGTQLARQDSKLTQLRASRDAEFRLLCKTLPINPTDRQSIQIRQSIVSLDGKIRRGEAKRAELSDKHRGLAHALIATAGPADNDAKRKRGNSGRPRTYGWRDFWAEIGARLSAGPRFQYSEDLDEFAADVTAVLWREPPDDKTIKGELAPLKEKLRLPSRPKKATPSPKPITSGRN
jgi:hypothetical protein